MIILKNKETVVIAFQISVVELTRAGMKWMKSYVKY